MIIINHMAHLKFRGTAEAQNNQTSYLTKRWAFIRGTCHQRPVDHFHKRCRKQGAVSSLKKGEISISWFTISYRETKHIVHAYKRSRVAFQTILLIIGGLISVQRGNSRLSICFQNHHKQQMAKLKLASQ